MCSHKCIRAIVVLTVHVYMYLFLKCVHMTYVRCRLYIPDPRIDPGTSLSNEWSCNQVMYWQLNVHFNWNIHLHTVSHL